MVLLGAVGTESLSEQTACTYASFFTAASRGDSGRERERERLSAARQAPERSAGCLSYTAGASRTGLKRETEEAE